jgi:penicillin-binding protein 1A
VTPLELTTAYAAFASGGNRIYPYLVTEVDSGSKILYRRNPPTPQRIIASHVNRDLVQMLYDVVQEGTGKSAAIAGHEAAGKTGTTQDYHDAWFVGFTTDYVTAVWVGNDDSSAMRSVTGGTLPATIWHNVMTAAERTMPASPLDKSLPGAPVETGLFASGPDDVGTNGDDEASNAAAEPEHEHEHASSGGRNFWDWLFGRNGNSGQSAGDGTPSDDEPPASDKPSPDDSGN